MLIYIFLIILLCLIVVLGKLKSIRIIQLRKLIIPVFSIAFILCLIMFSSTAVSSALKGISLWLNIVFPSLFPFFVASELLSKTGFVRAVGILLEPIMRPLFNVPGCGSFAFAMGITSGYPVGAKITSTMRKERLLTKTEAERLLTFTNNSGPLFIIGAVSFGMFKMPQLGLFLLLCHIISCITVGILFKFYGKREKAKSYKYNRKLFSRAKNELFKKHENSNTNFGTIFGDAVKSSVMMMLAIGGFIILFSVIINLLIQINFIGYISSIFALILTPFGINSNIITSLISGFFEITTGTSMASKAVGASIIQQLVAASAIIGWAGLSVHSQVLSIVSDTDISLKPYFAGKFMQGIFAAIYTFIGIKMAGAYLLGPTPAFSTIPSPVQWYDYFILSFENMMMAFGVLGILVVGGVLVGRFRRRGM